MVVVVNWVIDGALLSYFYGLMFCARKKRCCFAIFIDDKYERPPMRISSLFLCSVILFSEAVSATSFSSQCQQIKANIKSHLNADLKWSNYTARTFTSLDKIRFEGFDIPLVVSENMEESALLFDESPEFVMSSLEDDEYFKSQIVILNSNLLETFPAKHRSFITDSLFEMLKKSLDISSSDFVCDKARLDRDNLKNATALAEKSMLITLKSVVAPYGAIDAIRIKNKNAFIIRTATGFEYYELLNGKSLKILVETHEKTDLDQFINALESTGIYKEYSQVTAAILKAIKSKKSKDWEYVLQVMMDKDYSHSSQASIRTIIQNLSSH
ncbi:hypothetical protein N473_20675 [Pseudoalteromonas luteoviolacea CPMOR-1]|uniref:Uncharacterized protein n=1 Tax=Pseudoalteromonas luteoviolacea CPMOR-1 TaxID=1365248 RepID=A0A162BH22_9GAMM|nr:hypothetical protein [Pseudoalteromonas luteoviolacea]KZN61960.1 hypothetical protein N473_20675 [Pseudoalteromonas luteoviolacea CPMOR-1]